MRAFANRRFDQYPEWVLTFRVTIILSMLALGAACSDELRPVTPFGYYEPIQESQPIPEGSDAPEVEPERAPWFLPESDADRHEPIVFDEAVWSNGRAAYIDDRPWRPGVNGVGHNFRRRVIADEKIVGLHCLDARCVALSAAGGVFRTTPFGDWHPLPSNLPSLSRSFSFDEGIIACPGSGESALFSPDSGRTWNPLGYACGQSGRRTVDFGDDTSFVIVGQQIRIGHPVAGAFRMVSSPVIAPTALLAHGRQLIVFGVQNLAISEDNGETFEIFDAPPSLVEITDAAIDAKGLLAVVGRGQVGGSPIAVSLDAGRSWQQAPVLPDRTSEYHAVIIDKQRRVVASSHAVTSGAVYSVDMGRHWTFMDASVPLRGALAPYRDGALVATTQGIAVAMGSRGIYAMGLDQPLVDMMFVDPMRAVAIGKYGGLYRSVDAGHTWYSVPGTLGLPVTHLAQTDGVVIAVGPGMYRWSDSAGRLWHFGTSTVNCVPSWLTAKQGRAVLGCQDGQVLFSSDFGRSWLLGESPAVIISATWVDDGRYLLGLADDNSGYLSSTDGGATWYETDPLTSVPVQLMNATEDGVVLVSEDGRIAVSESGSTDMLWIPEEITQRFVDIIQVRAIRGDRLLVLDQHGLWSIEANGRLEQLTALVGAHGFHLVGDGGVVLIGRRATTHLTRVRR